MKRNIRFWTRYTWESIGADIIIMAILAGLAAFSAEGLDLSLFASVMPYFLCVGSIFGMILINASSHTLYVPLLLSMGETRRNVLLGFHYYRALIIASTTVLCALIWLLVPGEVSGTGLRSLPTLLCVLVLASSFGSILGTFFVRWKWLATVITVLICGGLGGTIGAAGVAINKGLAFHNALELTAYLIRLPWWLVLTALALFILDLLFQWLILRRQEVRL
ncbi:MAG: hypothetical protein K2P20_07385 [Oscillospiraceae bacterium]|nr:hypothetical protein [Oscillospiraceae bacterium]